MLRKDKKLSGRPVRRLLSIVVGVTLLLGSIVEAYFQSFGFYQDHYLVPKEKYGVLTPVRWQEIVWLMMFWPLAIGLPYASYRLLTYGFRRSHSQN